MPKAQFKIFFAPNREATTGQQIQLSLKNSSSTELKTAVINEVFHHYVINLEKELTAYANELENYYQKLSKRRRRVKRPRMRFKLLANRDDFIQFLHYFLMLMAFYKLWRPTHPKFYNPLARKPAYSFINGFLKYIIGLLTVLHHSRVRALKTVYSKSQPNVV